MTTATMAAPGVCWDCGGQCLSFKGIVHGWRCAACCAAYVEAGAVLGEAAEAKERARRLTQWTTRQPETSNAGGSGRRRGGGGSGELATGRLHRPYDDDPEHQEHTPL